MTLLTPHSSRLSSRHSLAASRVQQPLQPPRHKHHQIFLRSAKISPSSSQQAVTARRDKQLILSSLLAIILSCWRGGLRWWEPSDDCSLRFELSWQHYCPPAAPTQHSRSSHPPPHIPPLFPLPRPSDLPRVSVWNWEFGLDYCVRSRYCRQVVNSTDWSSTAAILVGRLSALTQTLPLTLPPSQTNTNRHQATTSHSPPPPTLTPQPEKWSSCDFTPVLVLRNIASILVRRWEID